MPKIDGRFHQLTLVYIVVIVVIQDGLPPLDFMPLIDNKNHCILKYLLTYWKNRASIIGRFRDWDLNIDNFSLF